MSAESTGNIKEEDLQVLAEAATGEVTEAVHPAGVPMAEWVFTNDKENPHIRQQFHLYMNATFANMIGLMHAKNSETGDIHTLIVGVENTEEGVVTYPLARILLPEEQNLYLAPDGSGGYLGESDE